MSIFPGNGKNSNKEDQTPVPAITEEYKERLELLYDVAQQASSFTEVSKLLEEILQVIQRLLQASASSLFLIDQERRELYVQAAGGTAASTLKQTRLNLDAGLTGWVAQHAKPLIVNDVAGDKRFNKEMDSASGFVTKSIIVVPLLRGQEVIGVVEVLNKEDGTEFNKRDLSVLTGFAATEALVLLVSMAVTALNNIKLHQKMLDGYKSTVEALVTAADSKDPYSCGHSRRVCEYVMLAAESLSLSAEELRIIEFGALLHDIGKIGIDDSILRRSRPLTDEEWYIIRKHPLRGSNIVGEIPFLEKARGIVLSHHERYDGKGYPQGLKGDNIPLGARLVAVADAFDTMTTDHSYRTALTTEEAIKEIIGSTGTQFCPKAAEAFINGLKKRKDTGKEIIPKVITGSNAESAPAEATPSSQTEALIQQEAGVLVAERTEEEPAAATDPEEIIASASHEIEQPVEESEKTGEEAPAVKEIEKVAPAPEAEIFEGDVQLAVPSPVDFEQMRRFKYSLKQISNLKIAMDSWSEEEGTVITVSLKEPIELKAVLSALPMVEKVEKSENKLQVVLTSSSITTD